MTRRFSIRPATNADLQVIRALHLANWRAGHKGIMSDAFLGAPVAQEMDRRWAVLPPKEDILIVAEDETAVSGFALVTCNHPDGPLLESLHVASLARGHRLGERLLREVAVALRDAGYDRLWLDVLRDNHGARRFYRRLRGAEGPVFDDNLAGQSVPALKVIWASLQPLLRE